MSNQDNFSLKGKRVLVTGSKGFVGSNFVPLLEQKECEIIAVSRKDYNLLEQSEVRRMFAEIKPEVVFHFGALSGGIMANKLYPADYNYQNMLMGTMVLHEAFQAKVEKYISLIGGCSYPAHAPSPIKETELFNGYPQPESAPYSLAKAMSVVQSQSYRKQHGFNSIILVPGNLYGPFDNFDLENSHVIPALIRKYYEAQQNGQNEITAWGTGKPVRDFVYIGDACKAILKAAEIYSGDDIINLSSGKETTIKELVETVAEVVGFEGTIHWDTTKPDGQMFKGFDVTRMRDWLDFECQTSLREGLEKTFKWYEENHSTARLKTAA
ncbi:MAG TPA: GDP-L-fucose synthase [Pyrinomonadaceae bacterium]|nr:GDP-L-fucose synthase [Pyrinomonadaceae bacterium]